MDRPIDSHETLIRKTLIRKTLIKEDEKNMGMRKKRSSPLNILIYNSIRKTSGFSFFFFLATKRNSKKGKKIWEVQLQVEK